MQNPSSSLTHVPFSSRILFPLELSMILSFSILRIYDVERILEGEDLFNKICMTHFIQCRLDFQKVQESVNDTSRLAQRFVQPSFLPILNFTSFICAVLE